MIDKGLTGRINLHPGQVLDLHLSIVTEFVVYRAGTVDLDELRDVCRAAARAAVIDELRDIATPGEGQS